MKILSNAHTHTIWCDGSNTAEEMILAAIQRGFVSLGFSIHSWTPYEPCGVTPEKEQLYRQELLVLREKYRGQLEILIGVERDSFAGRDFPEFDYHLDSVHVIEAGGEHCFVDWSREKTDRAINEIFGGDPLAYCRAYYRSVAENCAKSEALFIGHIDLVAKFNEGNRLFDESDPRYLSMAYEAAECAVQRGIPLEMNTGAITRGYRTSPYPALPILKFIREKGGQIIINSDAHSTDGVDTAFDTCVEMAQSCGFRHVLRLREKGLEEVALQ